MLRILWDPSSGSIKRASLKLLVMFCVRCRCLAAWNFGPVVCVSVATSHTRHTNHRSKISRCQTPNTHTKHHK